MEFAIGDTSAFARRSFEQVQTVQAATATERNGSASSDVRAEQRVTGAAKSGDARLNLNRPKEGDDTASPDGLTEEEQAVVQELQARDREVRNHEQAHARVGGQYAGEPSYTYQTGPDGQRYAIGGEVAIDVAPIKGDPEATIQKMEVVKAAALAPAEPSSQDRKVAALAESQRAQALADLMELRSAVNDPEAEPSVSFVV